MESVDPASFEDVRPPRDVFPRLSTLHLFGWMTATAVAFLPYQAYNKLAAQSAVADGGLMQSHAQTVAGVGFGVASGVYLFVAAATLYWRRRGYTPRLAPGHWLAYKGVVAWLLATSNWVVFALGVNGVPWAYTLLGVQRLVVSLVVLVWFVVLAVRSRESATWRLAYLVVALSPVGEVAAPIVASRIATPSSPGQYIAISMAIQGVFVACQTASVAAAMLVDWRRGVQRHWSHWIAVDARLLDGVSRIAYSVWYWFHAPL